MAQVAAWYCKGHLGRGDRGQGHAFPHQAERGYMHGLAGGGHLADTQLAAQVLVLAEGVAGHGRTWAATDHMPRDGPGCHFFLDWRLMKSSIAPVIDGASGKGACRSSR